jgi:hypothetical protein
MTATIGTSAARWSITVRWSITTRIPSMLKEYLIIHK